MNVRTFLTVWFTLAAFPAAACQVSSNLVLNCGFDTDLAHWSVAAGSCAHDDASGAAKIGSARCESMALAPGAHQMKIRQCVSGAAAGQYALGAYARRDSGSGVGCAVDVEAHADASCNDKARVESAKLVPQRNTFARSAPKDLALSSNVKAVSIEVACHSASAFDVQLDDVLFGADLIFANGFDFARPLLTAGATLAYSEDQTATAIDSTVTVTDTDSANLASASVSITSNFQSGQDLLACASCGAITPVYTPGTGVLTLTGSATLAAYQAALRSVTYENSSETPNTATRTITWLANDGSVSSLAVTSSVTITAVNDLPVVTAGATLAYTENAAATAIDTTLTVADADDTNIESATVAITANFQTAEDVLACGTCGGIAHIYTPGTGVLTLTGTATIAQYQAALRTVTYRNSSDNPSALARTITWIASDGSDSSLAATSTVNITAVNDAPVGVVPAGSPFAITGNVRRSIAVGTLLVGATDAEGSALTTQLSGVPTNGATVVVNANGSFTYNPSAGYEGSASFQFVVCDAAPLCSTPLTVGVTIAGMIWFVDDGGPTGTGRLTDPINSLAAFSSANTGVGNNPAANDNIFLYAGTYTGSLTLLAGQRLFGEGMSITLSAATGITPPAGSDALPTTVLANRPAWTSSGTTLTLANGNTIRGFNIGNSATTKIAGSNFGTLTVNEIALSGTGQALSLSTGAFSGSSAFDSIATTSSGNQGLAMAGVTGGTLTIGSTSVSGTTTQGILIGTTQANIAFGNTTIAAGSDGVSLQNNSAGTRSFGSLTITNGSGAGFLHAVGGGRTTISGTTTITNPGLEGINIQNAAASNGVTFANVATTLSGGTGVRLVSNAGAITFADLDAAPDAGQRAFHANANTGTISTTSGTLTGSWSGGPAANTSTFEITGASAASRTPLAMTLDSISATNDQSVGININFTSGSLGIGTTTVSNAGNGAAGNGIGIQVRNSLAGGTINFGNTTVNGSGLIGLRLGLSANGNAGNITFADLDIAPDANIPALQATDNSGTITTTSGTITASGAALQISGASTAARAPLAMVFDNVTSSGGTNNIALTNVSGSLAMNAGALSAATSAAVFMTGSTANVTYSGSVANTTSGISLTSNTGGTMTFRGGIVLNTGANAAFTATGGGTVNVCDENPCAPGATGALVNTLTTTTGTALTVTSTTIGANRLEFRSIAANGAPNGIALNGTGATGGLSVKGNTSGACGGTVTVNAVGTPATVGAPVPGDCSGGIIQLTTGAGIVLTNTASVSLTRLRIVNPGTDGIAINTINGFTLANSYISDSAGAAGDRGIELGDFSTGTAVNGAINVSNSTIGPTPHDSFGVGIGSGTSTWNISGTVFDDSQLNSGFNFEIRNATVSSLLIDGSVFQNHFADGMQMQPASGVLATITSATIQNSTFTGNNIGMDFNHDGTSNVTYKVLSNTFQMQIAQAVNFFTSATAGTGGTMNGRFDGNRIGNAAIFNSGGGMGIRVNVNGGADTTVLLNNNTIRQVPNGRGIELISRNGTGGTDATVTNNFVDTDFVPTVPNGGFSLSNIFLQSNCLTTCNTLRSDVRGNTVPAVAPNGELVAGQLVLIRTNTSTNQLVDNAPASASALAELTSNNAGSVAVSGTVTLIAGPISIPP